MDSEIKEFLSSSQKTKGSLEKFYILRLILDETDAIKLTHNPPYQLVYPIHKEMDVLNMSIEVPGLIKEVAVIDHSTKKIYSDADLHYIEDYKLDLYRIQRLINMLRNNINKLQFYMMKKLYFIMDKINFLLSEYEYSINALSDNEDLNDILVKTKNESTNLDVLLSNRSGFIDSQTSRMLTILTIITFPIILVAGWFGMNFSKKQMIFLNYSHGYVIVLMLCLAYLIICAIMFWKDILHLVI